MKPHWAIICMASSCQFLFLSCVPSVRIILENSLQLYLCNFPHVTWVNFYVSILSLFTRHLGHFSHVTFVTFQPPIPELCSWCQNSPRELFQLFANPLCLPLTEPFIGNVLPNGPLFSLSSFIFIFIFIFIFNPYLLSFAKPSLSPSYRVLYWKCFAKWTSRLSIIFYLYLSSLSFILIFVFIFYPYLLSFEKNSLSPSYRALYWKYFAKWTFRLSFIFIFSDLAKLIFFFCP